MEEEDAAAAQVEKTIAPGAAGAAHPVGEGKEDAKDAQKEDARNTLTLQDTPGVREGQEGRAEGAGRVRSQVTMPPAAPGKGAEAAVRDSKTVQALQGKEQVPRQGGKAAAGGAAPPPLRPSEPPARPPQHRQPLRRVNEASGGGQAKERKDDVLSNDEIRAIVASGNFDELFAAVKKTTGVNPDSADAVGAAGGGERKALTRRDIINVVCVFSGIFLGLAFGQAAANGNAAQRKSLEKVVEEDEAIVGELSELSKRSVPQSPSGPGASVLDVLERPAGTGVGGNGGNGEGKGGEGVREVAAGEKSSGGGDEGKPAADGDDDAEPVVSPELAAALYTGVAGVLGLQAKFLQDEFAVIKETYLSQEDARYTWPEMIQYRLDYYLSSSPFAKALLLLNSTFIVILLGSLLLSITQGESFANALWDSWTFVADPGTQSNAEKPGLRAVAFAITISGLVVFALMIGLITESVAEQVDDFKKGRSRVLENDHTLMIGWTSKSIPILDQLALAAESEGGASIVVLAERDKEDMEEDLKTACSAVESPLNLRGSQVVFRCGDPLLETELDKVGVTRAKSIICLTREDIDPEGADASMLRQTLSVKGALAKAQHVAPRITIELQDVDNKIKIELANPQAEVIVTHDVIGQIMVSCSRQPGLAFVLEHVMAFEGSEFYFEEWPELHGRRFREVLCAFDGAVVVGLKVAEDSVLLQDLDPGLTAQQKRVARVRLNPPDDYVLQEGDEVLVLAEDNDSYELNDLAYRETLSERGQQLRAQILASHAADTTPVRKRQQLLGLASRTLERGTMTVKRVASETVARASLTGIADDAWNSATESMGRAPSSTAKEKILFVGWRRDMADMIRSLDNLVQPGSELWLFASVPVPERVEKLR